MTNEEYYEEIQVIEKLGLLPEMIVMLGMVLMIEKRLGPGKTYEEIKQWAIENSVKSGSE